MNYENLFSKTKFQDQKKVFAKFFYAKDALPHQPLSMIASRTPEGVAGWGFKQERFKGQYNNPVPKIYNYLEYTFLRLLTLDQEQPDVYFVYSADKKNICFNSGLQDEFGNDLILSFRAQMQRPGYQDPDWVFDYVLTPQSDKYRTIYGQAVPEIAWYTKDSRDYVFNLEYTLNTELHEHVFLRAKERSGFSDFPDEMMRNYLCGVIGNIIPKLKRNYKVAIPIYYIKEQKMQLLLPFKTKEGLSTFLVERDDNHKIYIIKTVLDMDQAFFAARLITRPDDDWLDP